MKLSPQVSIQNPVNTCDILEKLSIRRCHEGRGQLFTFKLYYRTDMTCFIRVL
jgi:hypothetical protein